MTEIQYKYVRGSGWVPEAPVEDTWRTREGHVLKMSEMTDKHLENALNLFRRKVDDEGFCICDGPYEEGERCLHCRFEARIASLKREIARRAHV